MDFYPFLPAWLLAILFAGSLTILALAYQRRNPILSLFRHRLLLAIRGLTLLLVFFMLLCPGRTREERNLNRSQLVFLIDHSASMSTRDLPQAQSRLAAATAFLQTHPFARLADYPRTYYAFNSQAQRCDSPEALSTLQASGGTDLRQAIAQIDKEIGLNRLSALVLVSDGIDSSGFKAHEIPIPLMSVQTGTDLSRVKDLSITPFDCPDKINVGEQLALDIPLLMQGYETPQHVPLRVRVDGILTHTAEVELTQGRRHTDQIKVALPGSGIHLLRVEVEALPQEVSELNNQQEFIVEAVTAQDEVAAYFPLLNTGFRPLLREFTKAGEDRFTAIYRVTDHSFRTMGREINPVFTNGLPTSATALKQISCLILGAHNHDLLSPSESQVLEMYVRQGGSLICLGGSDAFGKIPPDSPLQQVLPVLPSEAPLLKGKFRVAIDPSDNSGFCSQVAAIISENGTSPEFTLNTINSIQDVKSGARIALWAENEGRYPLLVWHSYGRGKVFALLSNAFHLWGAPEKREANFARFWRHLVAYARRVDEMADLLSVTLEKNEWSPEEPIPITAMARHSEGANERITVTVDLYAQATDIPILSKDLQRQGTLFKTELPGLSQGRYVLRVTSRDGQTILRIRQKLLLVGEVISEQHDLRSFRDTFRAFSSERHLFSCADSEALEDALLAAVRKNLVQRESLLIFETPLFFCALAFLLLSEWLLRRRFNLF